MKTYHGTGAFVGSTSVGNTTLARVIAKGLESANATRTFLNSFIFVYVKGATPGGSLPKPTNSTWRRTL